MQHKREVCRLHAAAADGRALLYSDRDFEPSVRYLGKGVAQPGE
jgi:hypothetical protein